MSYKAKTLEEIAQAVQLDEPIGPDHPFFTDFSGVRGKFEEKVVYKALNVLKTGDKYTFNHSINSGRKVLFFLGGMRGSGKTSELAKIASKLDNPEGFYCITCNLDRDLDMNNIEYMDILIFQIEKLTQRLEKDAIAFDESILADLAKWFEDRSRESAKKANVDVELALGAGISKEGLLSKLLSLTGNLRTALTASKEWSESVRTTFRNKFNEFSTRINIFIEAVNASVRKAGRGKEVLFIVDGLEKVLSIDMRRKVIIDEGRRLQEIRAYTIFTLPPELMKERNQIGQSIPVESFPFIKIRERNGDLVSTAIEKFREFVFKRADEKLFESTEVVNRIIQYSGGSPRQLLQIIGIASWYVEEGEGKISLAAVDKAIDKMSGQMSAHLKEEELAMLRTLKQNNKEGKETSFEPIMDEMMEDLEVMEYNDGSLKMANPLIEHSNLYRQYVGEGD